MLPTCCRASVVFLLLLLIFLVVILVLAAPHLAHAPKLQPVLLPLQPRGLRDLDRGASHLRHEPLLLDCDVHLDEPRVRLAQEGHLCVNGELLLVAVQCLVNCLAVLDNQLADLAVRRPLLPDPPPPVEVVALLGRDLQEEELVHREHRLQHDDVALRGRQVEGYLDAGALGLLAIAVLIKQLEAAESAQVLVVFVQQPLCPLCELFLAHGGRNGRLPLAVLQYLPVGLA
mmetsp:Transcript_17807/g.40260  ORF Transcript_17807/g.40260 Transcript_17807/m.40260 type:complete len:230 (+) Transcript_17807:109-798(+)